MNKPLRRISIFCGLLILALLIRTNWLQYVQADELSIKRLKKRKLWLKDCISRLESALIPDEPA